MAGRSEEADEGCEMLSGAFLKPPGSVRVPRLARRLIWLEGGLCL